MKLLTIQLRLQEPTGTEFTLGLCATRESYRCERRRQVSDYRAPKFDLELSSDLGRRPVRTRVQTRVLPVAN